MKSVIKVMGWMGLATLAIVATDASAAGLEIPEQGTLSLARGGAFSAKADDPTAGIHNPGALSKSKGLKLLYDHKLLWSFTSFTRAESQIPTSAAVDDYLASRKWNEPSENKTPFFPLGVLLAASHDFGSENWTFGAQVYGPSNSGGTEYDENGGQRYMLTKLDTLVTFAGLSAAYGTDTYGVGLTLQHAMMPEMNYTTVVDGSVSGVDISPYASANDVVTTISLSDMFAYTAIVGAWWRPSPSFELALSGRILPIQFDAEGKVEIANVSCPEGERCGASFGENQLQVPNSKAQLSITMPQTARLGMRYRGLKGDTEVYDIELDVVYEGWSSIDEYALDLEGQIQLYGNTPVQDIIIPKRWRDTLSVRLGGTYAVVPETFDISLGGYYEQGATPENYTHLDFLSVDRVGVGAGFTYKTGAFDLSVAYSHVFQEDRTVTETYGKVMQQRPVAQCPDGCNGFSGVPANAGTFESSVDMLAVAVQAGF